MIPIDFLFGLHFIGYGSVAVYDVASGTERVNRRTQLWSFDPYDRYPDVVWDPTTGDLFVPIFLEQVLKRAVEASGKQQLLTQRIYRIAGHCGFSQPEMISAFDIADVNKAAAAFNVEKLQWLNQQHMKRAPVTQLALGLRDNLARMGVLSDDQPLLEGVGNIQRERARTLKDMAQNSRFFCQDFAQYDDKAARKHLTGAAVPVLLALNEGLKELPEWSAGDIHLVLDAVAGRFELPLGQVAQPLRVAISGTAVSPPIDLTVALLGRPKSLSRLQRAIEFAAAN